MSDPVKFTVIMPTRERADTLLSALRTIVTQDYEHLKIIVSDNFSQDNTKQVVDSFHDPRITYINTGKRVGMANNYEFALSHVKEGWVMIIGDDDGLLPGALSLVAQVIKDKGCTAIMSDVCRYDWPNVVEDNQLHVPLNSGMEWRDAREWFTKVMQGKAWHMDLPFLYTGGAVELSVINRARTSKGNFYCAFIPDVYSSLAITAVLDRFIMLKTPIAIAGRSSHSVGASTWGYIKNQAPAQQYFSENSILFDDKLIYKYWPKSYQVELYECYLKCQHLHHDFLKIKLEDQLGMALSRVPQNEYDVLREYCVAIAKRNGIEIAVLDNREQEFRKSYRREKLYKFWSEKICRGFNYRDISGKEFGIHNVYEASLLAKTVLLLETQYANWKLKKFFKGVKKIFGDNS